MIIIFCFIYKFRPIIHIFTYMKNHLKLKLIYRSVIIYLLFIGSHVNEKKIIQINM